VTTPRLTPERLAEIRDTLRTGRKRVSYVFIGRDLLRELDAVTAERDEARAVSEDPTTAPTTAHRARGDE
jgi:hypothetical protein